MAGGNGKRGGGDRVLESRHLAGLFLGIVVLCSVFFTLGYVMGRTQYGGSAVHAAASSEKPAAPVRVPEKLSPEAAPSAVPAPGGEWDFYTKKDNDHLQPAAAPTPATAPASAPSVASAPTPSSGAAAKAASPPPAQPAPAAARLAPPKLPKGTIVLQVAALTQQSDAMAMAEALQKKNFPAFVVAPTTDKFYRVQVGPYPDDRAVQSARSALDHAGFKAIIKR